MPAEAFRLDEDGIYRCGALRQFTWLQHGFGTRRVSPDARVTLRQIHSATVWNAAGLGNREREGDALVTDLAGLSIGVRTADCVPVLLVDSRRRVVAAVHAGWRGTAAEIVGATVDLMQSDFAVSPAGLYAAIGPCIRKCCYQTGAEVACRFALWLPELTSVETPQHLDLAEVNRRQMMAAGVPAAQIFDAHLCTACRIDTLFSYRREPSNPGRMTAAICRLD